MVITFDPFLLELKMKLKIKVKRSKDALCYLLSDDKITITLHAVFFCSIKNVENTSYCCYYPDWLIWSEESTGI